MERYSLATHREKMDTTDVDWDEVYTACLPRVFHFFCYKTGSPELAEELTAATFEKAWASRASFRNDRGPALAWLLGIARHVAVDHFRRSRCEISLEEAGDLAAAAFDDDLQRRLDFQKIASMLAHFSNRDRELVALKYGAELSNREIARATGLSESNVGTILHRVVARLRKEWEHEHG